MEVVPVNNDGQSQMLWDHLRLFLRWPRGRLIWRCNFLTERGTNWLDIFLVQGFLKMRAHCTQQLPGPFLAVFEHKIVFCLVVAVFGCHVTNNLWWCHNLPQSNHTAKPASVFQMAPFGSYPWNATFIFHLLDFVGNCTIVKFDNDGPVFATGPIQAESFQLRQKNVDICPPHIGVILGREVLISSSS